MTTSTVVELCGLPGSGKTHLARHISAALANRDVAVHQPAARVSPDVRVARRLGRKAGLLARQLWQEPGPSGGLVAALVDSGQRRPIDGFARWLSWSTTQQLIRESRGARGVHLLDEGVLQALWSIGLRADVEPVLRLLAGEPRRWQVPDLVIVIDAPVPVVDGRLSSRPSVHSRTQALDPVQRLRELERGQAVLDHLLSWWPLLGGPPSAVLRVANSEVGLSESAVCRIIDRIDMMRQQEPRCSG